MQHAHVCVWIDHREAKLFGIGAEGTDERHVAAAGPHHHIHRKADHVHQGKLPPDDAFLGAVAELLVPAQAILVVGPGTAKDELAQHLRRHAPQVAAHVWDMQAADHATDEQVVAMARDYFRAASRMHA